MAGPSVRERDDLYAVPPAQFTRARNALVARLRERGEEVQAREVARLRKPTAVVSAINRVARDSSADVGRLIKSVERLRRAQARAADDLPETTTAHRAAVARLVERVGAALTKPGASQAPDLTRRVEGTLLAAAADPGTQPALRGGRLTAELAPPGFEALAGMRGRHLHVVSPPPKPKIAAREKGKDETTGSRRAAEAGAPRAQRAAQRAAANQARKLDSRAAERQRTAQKLDRAADRLRARLKQLEDRVARARADADEASREAARLRGQEVPAAEIR